MHIPPHLTQSTMLSASESYFSGLIGQCRKNLERNRSNLLCRLGLRSPPSINDDCNPGQLRSYYELLASKGTVVWGTIAHANRMLFSPGQLDLPGVTVFSLDSYYDTHPQDLIAVAHACALFKNTTPTDQEFLRISEPLTDERSIFRQLLIPRRLSDNRDIYMGPTMFHRSRLPGAVLSASVFPLVIAPTSSEYNMVLPLRYWPDELKTKWNDFDRRVHDSPVASASERVAASAEKHPYKLPPPDWDVVSTPIRVTDALAQFIRYQAKHNNVERLLVQLIGRPDGGDDVYLADSFDPQTEEVFVSNGVSIVIRKVQRQRYTGAILDFQSSPFATGLIIRTRN